MGLRSRGNRFGILKIVLWLQVGFGFALAATLYLGFLTPVILSIFIFIDGALIGFSQPAFFGLINRIVSPKNLAAAVGINSSITQSAYIVGPLLAGLIFSYGIEIAPLAFALNPLGILVYLIALSCIKLGDQPERPASNNQSLTSDILAGISAIWNNPVVLGATVFILASASLQRPLISLMPAMNEAYLLFSPAYFTLLTASFMLGGVTAGLIHAARNDHLELENIFQYILAITILLFVGMFILLDAYNSPMIAMAMLFALGLTGGFITTGNSILLQKTTPEDMRSRVLGNTYMFNRALGAIAVAGTGLLIDFTSFTIGMVVTAIVVAIGASVALATTTRK